MSVVVRMEMPESCDVCPCLDDYGDYPRCRISGEQRGYTFPIREKRMPNCPIVCQLPEEHGRLIDEKDICIPYDVCDGHEAMDFVEESPTIVPAEAESPSPKPTDPVPIRDVYYVMTECDVKTGTVKYELRERSET